MSETTLKIRTAHRLRSVPLFSELSEESVNVLARLVEARQHLKGHRICGASDAGDSMYFVLNGRVRLCLPPIDGKELVLDFVEAPGYFGEMSVVGGGVRGADAYAVTDVELLELSGSDLARAIQVQPALALSMIATLSARLRQTVSRLEDLAFHDSTHRVMRVLLNVATAQLETSGVPVVQGMTHYDIASLAGTSRETASRVISALGREGLVETRGRRIIVDLPGLVESIERY